MLNHRAWNAGWNWVEFGAATLTGLATSGACALATNVTKAAVMTAGGELTANATAQLAKQAATTVEAAATGRVFYSGGDLARTAAEEYAIANGGTTLGLTSTGRAINATIDEIGYTATRPFVEQASRSFANGATGEVHVFINLEMYSQESVWATIERQALIDNMNVTDIIYHTIDNGYFLGP